MRIFIHLLLVGASAALAQSNDWEIMSPDEISVAYRLYGFNNCDKSRQNAVLEALRDKHKITGAAGVQNIDWHGAAAVDFLGYVSPCTTAG
jgi:hypothetical protein